MAITIFEPSIHRSRAFMTQLGQQAILKAVPEYQAGESLPARGVWLILGSAFGIGLLALLVINTLLTQDAFTLSHLKHQVNVVNDQRDAVLTQLEAAQSPLTISIKAQQLGMVEASAPTFINYLNQNIGTVAKK
jgi:hypothetical protein